MAEFRLETERLILRDWREEDWEPFFEHTNTPAVMRWLGPLLDEEARTRQKDRLLQYKRDHGFTFWAVERKDDGALLGFCGLKRCNQEGGPIGAVELGYRLREEAWGNGYAREAATASLDLAFDRFEAEEVIALTVQRNTSSWGLMERLGMQRREDLDFTEEGWDVDDPTIIVYSITPNQWKARSS